MESFFSRLFKYRPREHRNPTEDFFTEIFAFLLENIDGLLAEILNCFNITPEEPLKVIEVETQRKFPGNIRPDIFIRFSANNQNWIVFIENKVGAAEGDGQLKKYSDYLEKEANQGTKTALLYITQFHDPKDAPSTKIIFEQKRWWQIHEILGNFTGSSFVSEARLFMEENNLSLSKSFSTSHITAMMFWNEVKEMMDRSLGDVVEEKFREVTKGKYSSNSISKNLRDYGDYFQAVGYLLCFEIGYFLLNSRHENQPEVGGAIIVQLEHPKRAKVVQALYEFATSNSSWELSDNFHQEDEEIWIEKGRPLQEFLSLDDHISAIQKWFLEILSDVKKFQKDYPQLKWD